MNFAANQHGDRCRGSSIHRKRRLVTIVYRHILSLSMVAVAIFYLSNMSWEPPKGSNDVRELAQQFLGIQSLLVGASITSNVYILQCVSYYIIL